MRISALAVVLLVCNVFATPAIADIVLVNEAITKASFGPSDSYTVITIKIKGDRHRIDLQVKGVVGSPLDSSTIVDNSNGTIIRLSHSRKVYDRVTLEELEKGISFTRDMLKSQGVLPTSRPILRSTGKTDTVNSYTAAEYTCTRSQGNITWNMTYWLATSLSKFVPILAQAVDPSGSVVNLQFPDPASFAGVPVRVIIDQRLPGGQVLTTINLLSFEEKTVNDSEFLIPAGYVEETKPGANVKQ
jgi:hypothetical protein